jgi:hypothetical protein
MNKFIGACIGGCVIAALWFTDSFWTGHLPINSNRVFDNTGNLYNVSRAINEDTLFNAQEYNAYSFPFLSAGNLNVYVFFFAIYSATLSYAFLYHRHEIALGFKNTWKSLRRKPTKEDNGYQDVHNRLMASYAEAPEWW